jgi:hypothetical protein
MAEGYDTWHRHHYIGLISRFLVQKKFFESCLNSFYSVPEDSAKIQDFILFYSDSIKTLDFIIFYSVPE